ncbi:MAG: putative DNA binding domain-containing protein [Oligoflexia bacterium]|nr:putative DNA binding domain-containing protein [Oligoflexia bacterium]
MNKNNNKFALRESKSLEIKETIPQKNQLIKTCVAFANAAGGEIIIGVEDSTYNIVGVSDEIRDKIFEDVVNSIMDSIAPHLIPEIYEKNINGKRIVIIKIFPGSKPPYFVTSEGSKKGVYLRNGSITKRATEEYIEELFRQQKKIYFDECHSELLFGDLDKDLLKELYGKGIGIERALMDKIAVRSIRDPHKLFATHAALLFFHSHPENYIPEATVICTEFKGTKGRDIIRTIELKSPIPQLIESTLKLVASWIERDLKVSNSGKMEGKYMIPLVALREGIVNALVHRKYFIPGAVKVALYEDRLEIFSPGELPGLLSIENLGDGTTFLRNPTIAKFARMYKLIEKLGSGIRLIFDSCKEAGIRKPVFYEGGDFVKIIYFFGPELGDDLTCEEKIIQLGKSLGEFRIKDLVERIGFSRNTATRKMNTLVMQKLFDRHGKGAGVYFVYRGSHK